MFEHQLADVWDLIYQNGRGKDYHAEAELVAKTILDGKPDATSLLDVGCGTGEHLAALSTLFDHVEGTDISEHMVRVAQAKVPSAKLHVGDMVDLDLGRTFDAVVSLYTVVGYLPSLDALRTAIRRLVAHLEPDGVLIVEPWWFKEQYLDGYIAGDVVRDGGRTVSRVSRTVERDGRASMDIHYVVADEHGIRHFTEHHDFGLWTREEYFQAFEDAGCTATFVPDTLYCGMFVARRT